VRTVSLTADRKKALSGSRDETLISWDIESGNEINTLSGHGSVVNAVAVTPDGKRAVSGSSDNTLKVWDIESGHELATFTADGHIYGCAVGPDCVTIVAGDSTGAVHFLRLMEPRGQDSPDLR